MKWTQRSRYHLACDSNFHYRIAKVHVFAAAIYELWLLEKGAWRVIGSFETSHDAKVAADKHANGEYLEAG